MNVSRPVNKTLLLSLLLIAIPTGLLADVTDSRISAVTVYADRAIVTRTSSSQFAAGEHSLTFENLPASLVDQSLQASGTGVAGAVILDVTSQNVFAEAATNERVKSLEDQIKVLKTRRRVLDDRNKILEDQKAFIQRMLQASTSAPTGGAAGSAPARPTLDEWQKLFSYSEESLGKIAGEQQSIDEQRDDIQAKQTVLEQQLNVVRGASGRRSKTVTIRIALTTAGKLDVALRYAVPNAGWSPAYDARLRSADRAVDLDYFGVVRNGTGEDWKDIALTLSTARPNLGGGAPELRPWIADIARPRSEMTSIAGFSTRDAISVAGGQTFNNSAAAPGGFADLKKEGAEATLPTAAVETNITSATFKIQNTVSIPGNNVTQKVAISGGRFGATLQFQSTPKVVEAAFLSAYANNTSEFPLLAGPMNTFLDDAFIASSTLKTVMPGEKFELALGVDDGISVKRKLVNRFSEDTGSGNKTRKVTYEFLVTLTNTKKTTERVVFKEPTPISRDEKIVVKTLTPQEKEIGTIANPKEVSREEDGKLVWRVNLRPGEKREFPLKLSVEYPGDIAVTGLE